MAGARGVEVAVAPVEVEAAAFWSELVGLVRGGVVLRCVLGLGGAGSCGLVGEARVGG